MENIDYRVHSMQSSWKKRQGSFPCKVMKQFNVVVTLPDRSKPNNSVVITGRKKNAEDAKFYLVDLAQDLMADVYGGSQ